MNSLCSDFPKTHLGLVELVLTGIDASIKTMRSGLDAIVSSKPRFAPHAPPVQGPQDLDTALADFANQLVRIGWFALPQSLLSGRL